MNKNNESYYLYGADGETVWSVTDGGKMLVEALCKTPIPIKKWSMP